MSYLYLLWQNLARKKLRSAMTLFSIVTAFLIFGVLGSFQVALNAGVELAGADRLVVVNKISFIQPMPYSYYARTRAMDGVRNVTHANWFGGYFQDPRQVVPTFAVEAESYLDIYPELVIPEAHRENWLKNRRGALVGRAYASQFGWRVGDTVPLTSNIFTNKDGTQTWEVTVEGIADGNDPKIDTRFVLIHYDYFNKSLDFNSDTVGWLIVSVDDPAMSETVARGIDEMNANSPFETRTSSEEAFNKAFLEQIGDLGLIISSVVGAAFFTILLVAGNSMALAVRERTREIGVMKALGFSSPGLFRMVLAESLLMAMAGGLSGLGLAVLAVGGLKSQIGAILPSLVVTSGVVTVAVALMVALGVLTGAIPAWHALRLNVVLALRGR